MSIEAPGLVDMGALHPCEDRRQRRNGVYVKPGSKRKADQEFCSIHDGLQGPHLESVWASLKAFAKDFKLSTPMPAEIVGLTSRRRNTPALRQSNSMSGMEEHMVKPSETVNNPVRPTAGTTHAGRGKVLESLPVLLEENSLLVSRFQTLLASLAQDKTKATSPVTPPPPALTSTVPVSTLYWEQTEQTANGLSRGFEAFNLTVAHPPLWREHCLYCLEFFSTTSFSGVGKDEKPSQTKKPRNSYRNGENCWVNHLKVPPKDTRDVLSARPPINTVCPDTRGRPGKLDLSKMIQHMPEFEKKAEKEDEGVTASRCTAGTSGAQARKQQPQQQIPARAPASSSAYQQEQLLEESAFVQDFLSRERPKQVYTYTEQFRKVIPITAEEIAEAAAAGVVSGSAYQQDPEQQQQQQQLQQFGSVQDSLLGRERPKGPGIYESTEQYREAALINAQKMAAAVAAVSLPVQTVLAAQAAEDSGDDTPSSNERSDEDYEFIDRDE